jgi:succinyl-diaminopimelate desuccinylase
MKKDIFINQLKKLVAFETVTGNFDENSRALDFVENLLPKNAFKQRFKNKNAEILVVSNTKSKSPDVGFLVHIDVVSGRSDQFKIVQKGEKLFGRGTSDMKFSIPIGVSLLNDLIEKKSKLSFSLAITTDEETGGYEGVTFLANKIKFQPKCLIVPDGGENLNFVDKSKGVCQVFVESKGAAAHASRPWMGKNALEPIVELTNKLIKKYSKNNSNETWKTTMNIGIIQGGISTNQVCSSALLKLDFRFPETESAERIMKEINSLAKGIKGNLTISAGSVGMPTFTDKNLPVVKEFLTAMKKAYGKTIIVKKTFGASDARHFAPFNIPILMMKPLAGEMHSEDEWVSINSCMKFYEGLETFLERIEKQ